MAEDLHDATAWPVRTARLALRPAVASDWEATWRFRRLPEVARWLTSAPTDAAVHRDWFTDPSSLAMTVVIEREGTVVGDLMVKVQDAWAQAEVADRGRRAEAELGWVLHPGHQGHGYAAEAVAEVLRICFEDLGVRRVVALCFADNEASWRLMERLHMRREAHNRRDSLHRDGRWLDGYGYALLADEWRALTDPG